MRLRVVIFDDEPAIRQVLGALCEDRGYEVFTFADPTHCPLYLMPPCPCPPGTVCADLLLIDRSMPVVEGLRFVADLRAKGCPAPQIALMSGAWPPPDRARQLGCHLLPKPFALADLFAWFDTVEAQVASTRALLEWPAQGGRRARSATGAWP